METPQALDQQPRPPVRLKKKQLERLKRLASKHREWVLGYAEETWWSRFERPNLHAWAGEPGLRLPQLAKSPEDPDPKALCCYGLLRQDTDRLLLRFVDGRPVSQVTVDFLDWICGHLAAEGRRVLVLIWDNASWHKSQPVRSWIKDHNRTVKRAGG